MRVPQVSERIKEAPAQALRGVFAGIGQLLLITDKIRHKTPADDDVPRARAPETAETVTDTPVTSPAGSPGETAATAPAATTDAATVATTDAATRMRPPRGRLSRNRPRRRSRPSRPRQRSRSRNRPRRPRRLRPRLRRP